MHFATSKPKTAKTSGEGGQALIELTITVVFFLVIMISLEQMVRSYRSVQLKTQRMTRDITRPN